MSETNVDRSSAMDAILGIAKAHFGLSPSEYSFCCDVLICGAAYHLAHDNGWLESVMANVEDAIQTGHGRIWPDGRIDDDFPTRLRRRLEANGDPTKDAFDLIALCSVAFFTEDI